MKPEVKIVSGAVDDALGFKATKDIILSQDVTNIDVAEVIVPKGYILLFCPISTNTAILTSGRYTEGKQTIKVKAYALPRVMGRISKDSIIGQGILIKKEN